MAEAFDEQTPLHLRRPLGASLWKQVEDGWLNYHAESGDTGLISDLARFMLETLDEQHAAVITVGEMMNRVQAEEPDFPRAEIAAEVAQTAIELCDAGWIGFSPQHP